MMTEERVPVSVMGVYAHEDAGVVANHFVLFQDEAKRRMPIFIGQFAARAISLGLEDKAPDRPFTFEAMLSCLLAAGATVEEVYINDIRDETFYALVSLRVGNQVHQVDMRPSDAVNLAIRAKCPLFVSEKVMQACRQSDEPSIEAQTADDRPSPTVAVLSSAASPEISEELARLFAEDQADRTPAPHQEIDRGVVIPRDAARLARVKELYQSQALHTGKDFYFAAMILQHAHDPDDYLLAHEFCVIAVSQGVEEAKWLAAASEDRFLMNIGRPQRFGTQYRIDGTDGKWSLYDVGEGVTDSVRRGFNVPPLSEAQEYAEKRLGWEVVALRCG